jgi:NAD-dependent dihydropyrimidine dehydrogenase PreA subunit
MPYTIIDACTGCSACESRCPTRAIHGVKKELYYIDPELCIDCGACGVVCPDESILDTFGRLCENLKSKQRPKAYVELEKCTGCVYCANTCPFNCITMEDAPPTIRGQGIASTVAVIQMRKCTGCTVCELDCPYDAIHIWRQDDPRALENEAHNKELWAMVKAAEAASGDKKVA